MLLTTLALVAAAVVVLALVGLVLRLRRRLNTVILEVADLKARLDSEAEAVGSAGAAAESSTGASAVAVITDLSRPSAVPSRQAATSGKVVSVTLAEPLIKVVAFTAGVRRALDDEHRMRVRYAFRRELKRQRQMRRRSGAVQSRHTQGWLP